MIYDLLILIGGLVVLIAAIAIWVGLMVEDKW